MGPITRRINVLYKSRMKWTWHHSKLAFEEISFFGGLKSGTPSTIIYTRWSSGRYKLGCDAPMLSMYEVRDLFPWEILTKMVIQYLLKVEKQWNYAQIKLSSTFNFYRKIFFRRNHIHRKIDQWNRRRFGAKRNVTVPNSVTTIKSIACEWICMSDGWYSQMTRELHISKIFIGIFVILCFWAFFIKFMTKSAVFCRLVQQELSVTYETSIFGQCLCCTNINYPGETELDTNPTSNPNPIHWWA